MRSYGPLNAVFLTLIGFAIAGCGEIARLSVAEGTGPEPRLLPPATTLVPTMNVATAKGWPVADDVGNVIWRVAAATPAVQAEKTDNPRAVPDSSSSQRR